MGTIKHFSVSTLDIISVTSSVVKDNYIPNGIENLHLQKLFWSQGELRAKVIWKAKRKPLRYTVSWWSGPCHNNIDGYTHFKLAATTKVKCCLHKNYTITIIRERLDTFIFTVSRSTS